MRMQKQEGASAIFYLRPGNLYKDFLVAKCTSGIDGKGRPVKKYESNDSAVIHAVLAQATPQEKARWEQIQHPITHDCGPGAPESSGNGPADMRKPQVLCAGR